MAYVEYGYFAADIRLSLVIYPRFHCGQKPITNDLTIFWLVRRLPAILNTKNQNVQIVFKPFLTRAHCLLTENMMVCEQSTKYLQRSLQMIIK